ncbi:hypothetical protein B0H12DRAFT_1102364, partial [Mycena haematopus]
MLFSVPDNTPTIQQVPSLVAPFPSLTSLTPTDMYQNLIDGPCLFMLALTLMLIFISRPASLPQQSRRRALSCVGGTGRCPV